jgi:hypothetical protein
MAHSKHVTHCGPWSGFLYYNLTTPMCHLGHDGQLLLEQSWKLSPVPRIEKKKLVGQCWLIIPPTATPQTTTLTHWKPPPSYIVEKDYTVSCLYDPLDWLLGQVNYCHHFVSVVIICYRHLLLFTFQSFSMKPDLEWIFLGLSFHFSSL